ncbi:hypothetical protein UP3_c0408 [Ureaplasma parvum serovar 3]|nr:hypothetical protein UP3_c0408 [Ureaplasma parvum serovar 3]
MNNKSAILSQTPTAKKVFISLNALAFSKLVSLKLHLMF